MWLFKLFMLVVAKSQLQHLAEARGGRGGHKQTDTQKTGTFGTCFEICGTLEDETETFELLGGKQFLNTC